ncbi:hypothetical protein KBD68_03205 [Candidatus Woesebacteria bacterium]|nr:hypothetical protein [Candidatus Woesebacteria bacterium]
MAALTQKVATQVPKSAAQMARLIASNAKNEMARVSETAQAQILSTEIKQTPERQSAPIPEVINEIQNEGVETVNREQLATWEKSRIKQLEDMIASVRRQEAQKLVNHNEMVQKEMQAATTSAPVESVGVVGKAKKAMGQVKQKVQSFLTSKKQSESKGGSGKG